MQTGALDTCRTPIGISGTNHHDTPSRTPSRRRVVDPRSRSRRMYVERGNDDSKYRRVAKSHLSVLRDSVFTIARAVYAANTGEITVGAARARRRNC